MKFSTLLTSASLAVSTVIAAPIKIPTADISLSIPAEAIIGYMNFLESNDIAMLPFSTSTDSGLLFVNTTIYAVATAELELTLNNTDSLGKREADAEASPEAWHWLRLDRGQPIY